MNRKLEKAAGGELSSGATHGSDFKLDNTSQPPSEIANMRLSFTSGLSEMLACIWDVMIGGVGTKAVDVWPVSVVKLTLQETPLSPGCYVNTEERAAPGVAHVCICTQRPSPVPSAVSTSPYPLFWLQLHMAETSSFYNFF